MPPWTPLLHATDAEEAWTALRAIGDALVVPPTAPPPGASLASGSAGIALFLSHLADALPDAGYGRAADAWLEATIDALPRRPLSTGLCGGVAGVAWTLRHLAERFEDGDEEGGADTGELDALLLAALARPGFEPEYDLVSGLAGFGVYALEALPEPVGRRCLERIVGALDERSEVRDEGVTWFTPPERVPEVQRRAAPDGYYNLGLAHGVPAVVVLLAGCCRAGVEEKRSRRLLDGAMAWLLARRQDPAVGSAFASWVGPGIEPHRSRLAWCYGDPGVGAAVLTAGLAVEEESWCQAGREILRGAARRPVETAEVVDAGLCHGAAGLGLLFARAFHASGDSELGRAAAVWYRRTLDLRRPGEGFAGWLSWEPAESGGLELRGVPGLLTGTSGVGLALLAAVTSVEPAWDRTLGLSLPVLDRAVAGLPTAPAPEPVRGSLAHEG